MARPGADREGHRPAAGGARARDLDRPRLRAARPSGRPPPLADRRPGARALRPEHGRRAQRGSISSCSSSTPPRGRGRRRTSTSRSSRCSGSSTASSRSPRRMRSTPRRSSSRVEEARELVPGAEVVAVSAKTGAGLDELKAALRAAADLVLQKHNLDCVDDAARLYVDRVFSLRGIGTVATGTLWSGSIGAGDVLRAEPGGRDVRVRSVQVHDRPVERAEPGQRVARRAPGRRAARAAAGRRAARARSVRDELPARRRARGARADRGRRAPPRPPRHRGRAGAGRAGRGGLRSAPARSAGRRSSRRPRRPPWRDDRRRRRRHRPGSSPSRRSRRASSGLPAAR